MLDTVLGLPVHPLIVHATVVVVPTAALAVGLYAVWPRFRAWARWGPLALALAANPRVNCASLENRPSNMTDSLVRDA